LPADNSLKSIWSPNAFPNFEFLHGCFWKIDSILRISCIEKTGLYLEAIYVSYVTHTQ
jgi:hypothetical protein